MGARMILIAEETPDQPEIHRFLRLGDERSASLYPAESNHALNLFRAKFWILTGKCLKQFRADHGSSP